MIVLKKRHQNSLSVNHLHGIEALRLFHEISYIERGTCFQRCCCRASVKGRSDQWHIRCWFRGRGTTWPQTMHTCSSSFTHLRWNDQMKKKHLTLQGCLSSSTHKERSSSKSGKKPIVTTSSLLATDNAKAGIEYHT